ncbi:unnamed protein product [Arabis nemorensis]|uniref:Nop domain-containing protein n=1 Tax=Arabis nemorensis TaxID=586526 RepID=A0A565C8M2_9BRAS|nr:unnamed protein product [Arabis nemorensis]
MIIKTIGLLDDHDKELNKYAKRVGYWYGCHFPELDKIIKDNILYILADKVEAKLKKAALKSKGKEASDLELMRIQELCDEVLSLAEYRAQLYDKLKSGMNKCCSQSDCLSWGASWCSYDFSERELKKNHATPKYGFIYHAPLVRQAKPKHKGKIARSLTSKAALAIRCDALGDGQNNTMELVNRAKLEARLRNLEARDLAKSKAKRDLAKSKCETG